MPQYIDPLIAAQRDLRLGLPPYVTESSALGRPPFTGGVPYGNILDRPAEVAEKRRLLLEQLEREAREDEVRKQHTLALLRRAGGRNMLAHALQGQVSPELEVTGGPLPPEYGGTNAAIMNILDRVRGQQGQGPFAATDERLDNLVAESQRQQMLNSLTPSQRRMLMAPRDPVAVQAEQDARNQELRKMLLRAPATGDPEIIREQDALAQSLGISPSRIGIMGRGGNPYVPPNARPDYRPRTTVMTPETHGTYGLMGNRVVPRETREQKGLENLTRRYRQKVRMLGRTLGLSEGFNPETASREELKGELERLRGARVQRNLTRIGKQREEEAFQQRRAQQQAQRDRFLQSLPLPLRIKAQQQMAEYDLARRQLEGEAEDRDIKRAGQEQTGAYQQGMLELNREKFDQEKEAARRQFKLDKRGVDIEQKKADTQSDLLAWEKLMKTKEFKQAKAEFDKEMEYKEDKQEFDESMAAQALGFQELQLGNPRFESMRQELNARITLSNRIIKTAQFVRDNPSLTEAQKQIMFADAAKHFQDEWEDVEGAPDWSASNIETAVNRYLTGEFDRERLEAAFGDDIGFFGDFWRNTLNWIPGVPDYLYPTPAVEDI